MKTGSTRRNFMALAALSTGVPLSVPAAEFGSAAEYRRGGMVYRRLGRTELWPSLLSFGSHTDPADLLDPAFRHSERRTRRLRWNGIRLARSVPDP